MPRTPATITTISSQDGTFPDGKPNAKAPAISLASGRPVQMSSQVNASGEDTALIRLDLEDGRIAVAEVRLRDLQRAVRLLL